MRVLTVGNYGPENSTENDLAHALEELDVTVVRVQEDDWIAGKVSLPAPDGFDLLLWTHTPGFGTSEHTNDLSAWQDVPKVGYHLDRWSGLRRAASIWSDPYWEWLDWWFTADPAVWMWQRLALKTVWTPPAVSTRWLDPVEPDPERWPYEIVMIGNQSFMQSIRDPSGYHIEHTHRPFMIEQLRKRYGKRFKILPDEDDRIPRGQRVHPRDLSVLYATVPVVVGDSCLAGVDAMTSDRVPETIGRGGLLVHPEQDWRDTYKPGVHLLTFGAWDWDQMQDAIDFALNDPDTSDIREEGRAHVLANHTYTERMRRMLEVVL